MGHVTARCAEEAAQPAIDRLARNRSEVLVRSVIAAEAARAVRAARRRPGGQGAPAGPRAVHGRRPGLLRHGPRSSRASVLAASRRCAVTSGEVRWAYCS